MGLAKGLVQVYTGEGKGKTTAALGLALRAVGRGLKVVVIQFLKADGATGELMAARRLLPELEIKSMGRPGFIGPEGPTAEDIALAGAAGTALLLITHDLGIVAQYCERALVMQHGRLVEDAAVHALFRAPQSDYTAELIAASRGGDA